MTPTSLRAFNDSLGLDRRGCQLSRALGLPESTDGKTMRRWMSNGGEVPGWLAAVVELCDAVPEAREWLRDRATQDGTEKR
jgi:hypothetical protein